MKHLLRTSLLLALVCALSSFTSPGKTTKPVVASKSAKPAARQRFPLGANIGYITSNGAALNGSFRVTVDDSDRTTVIYMVSTVTNGYYVVTGTYDATSKYVSVYYQGASIYYGTLSTTPGTVPPTTGGVDVE